MEDYYNATASSYDELHEEEQRKKLELVKKHWKINGLILDIGCGTNIANDYFKNIIGIDKSIKMFKKGTNVCCKAEELPFKDRAFDGILCLTAMHNFDYFNRAIKEMKRVLKGNNVSISVLKKAKNFNKIKNAITKNFNVRAIDEEKDVIFIYQRG